MKRGGKRPGAGRPRTERTEIITVRISKVSKAFLEYQNKSEIIDELIRNAIKEENTLIEEMLI